MTARKIRGARRRTRKRKPRGETTESHDVRRLADPRRNQRPAWRLPRRTPGEGRSANLRPSKPRARRSMRPTTTRKLKRALISRQMSHHQRPPINRRSPALATCRNWSNDVAPVDVDLALCDASPRVRPVNVAARSANLTVSRCDRFPGAAIIRQNCTISGRSR